MHLSRITFPSVYIALLKLCLHLVQGILHSAVIGIANTRKVFQCPETVIFPAAGIMEMNHVLVDGLTCAPVSYTHLDVYKRQQPDGFILNFHLYAR